MGIPPDLKFKKVFRGYDPYETHTVIEELQREISDLKRRLQLANEQMEQDDKKIRQLERALQATAGSASENKWLTDFMQKSADIAEAAEQAAAGIRQRLTELMDDIDEAAKEAPNSSLQAEDQPSEPSDKPEPVGVFKAFLELREKERQQGPKSTAREQFIYIED